MHKTIGGKKRTNIQAMTIVGILSAIAYILMFLEFSVGSAGGPASSPPSWAAVR